MSSVEHLGYAGVSPAPSQASVNQESAAERRRNIAKLVAACAVSAAVFCAMLVSGASSSTEAASSGQSAISNTWQKLVAVGGGDTDAEPMEAIEPVPHRSEDRLKELLNHWVPITGMILSIFLDFAPLEQILLCRRSKSMGQVNADVFPFLFGNNVGWVMYASLTHNFYMFVACFPSVMLAMFYILTGYMLAASDAARVRIEVVTLTMLGLWSALGYATLQNPDEVARNNVIGCTANVTMLLLFASPLSTMATIIETKNASSINKPFTLLQVITCVLWLVYGIVLGDKHIIVPNILATAFGVVQLSLLGYYGAEEPEGHYAGPIDAVLESLLTPRTPRRSSTGVPRS